MDSTTYLNRFKLFVGNDGTAVALQRGPGGVTYKAEDMQSGQPVAVKLVPSYSFEPAELQQLESEARAAQQVDHANIARLYDFGIQGGDVVFVTELLDGSTLDAWVAEHGPLPAAAVARIGIQVVAGLAAAAFHSVVHRAIQPASLMIVPGQAPDGEWPFVKVLNFGGVPPSISASEFSFGRAGSSTHFASPEQLKGYPVDFRSEIYSLGCTMWFLLTGAPPAPGTADKGNRVPKALRPVLGEMVALDPMQRPQDPVRLQDQLRDALARLERREFVGRTFGASTPETAAAAATTSSAPKTTMMLLKPLALAAAVLALCGIAAMALPGILRSRSTAAEPIGVPVGVPEAGLSPTAASSPAAAVASNAAPATAPTVAAAASSPATTEESDMPSGTVAESSPAEVAAASSAPSTEPEQAVVSAQPASTPPVTDSSSATQTTAPAISNGTAEPATVAASSGSSSSADEAATQPASVDAPADGRESGAGLPPRSSSSQQRVAQSSASTDSNEEISPSSSTTTATPKAKVAATRDDDAVSKATAPRASDEVPAATPAPTRPAKVAKSAPKRPEEVAKSEVRRAEPVDDYSTAPPVPRGSQRAKYLGTTPEGDLIFGLPSEQRGYVAPPPASKSGQRRRRSEPVYVEPDPAVQQALPAEPVDPDEEEDGE